MEIRRLEPADAMAAMDLLDRSLGSGFGHVDASGSEIAFVACADAGLAGIITVSVCTPSELEASYAGRVSWPDGSRDQEHLALLSQIAVEPAWRGRGIGDALVGVGEDAVADRFDGGIKHWVANAWVHDLTGLCPVARLLERSGYCLAGFVPGFFAAMPSLEECPGCLSTPCRCGVKAYFKRLAGG